jgi:hypothetical protein
MTNDSTKSRNENQWQIIDEEFISYTGGTAQLISNGKCKVHLWETPEGAQLFCDRLNDLIGENQRLRERLVECDDVVWLRENTVWEVMPSSHRTYTETSMR